MIQAVDPWTDFEPYATKIADFCRYVPGMQVRGLLPVGAAELGRVYAYPDSNGVVLVRPQSMAKLVCVTAPAPDLSDPITLAFVWPVLQKHLTADELIALRALAAMWSLEPPTDIADDLADRDVDHD